MPSSSPKTTMARPLAAEPELIEEAATSPSTIIEKNSAGPNFRPRSAIIGENSTSRMSPLMAPTSEAIVVTNRARPERPFLAIG